MSTRPAPHSHATLKNRTDEPDVIGRQPLLHDAVIALAAPTQVWSRRHGDLGEGPVDGVYHHDTRVLSRVALRVADERPEVIAYGADAAGTVWFDAVLRALDDPEPDPKVRLRWSRAVTPGRVVDTLTFSSALPVPVRGEVVVDLTPDAASMAAVKAGRAEPATADDLSIHRPAPDGRLAWTAGSVRAGLEAPGAVLTTTPNGATLGWKVEISGQAPVSVGWTVELHDERSAVRAAPGSAPWADVRVDAGDTRLARWIRTALADLTALRLSTHEQPGEAYVGAGAPWFFTLFGRDALWAARFLLPLGTDLAAGTLRTLAALQGRRIDAETGEQPGKILHELRDAAHDEGRGLDLPPRYYGSIDATPLWIIVLHEAWHWGLPEVDVADLLDPLEAALGWLRDHGDSDADGFLEYLDGSGHGLANQGWKDSSDAVQFADGRLARGPIALCEVQGYAYQAALAGADLLEHFGRPAHDWREWAAALRIRFAAQFWVDGPQGRFPAVALDADKVPVDSLTSNIGHLLGTGLLDADESRLVADLLVSPALCSGYGLRTLATTAAGYWPLSYHVGSVWTHDTAIAVAGLRRAGFATEAGVLIGGLLAAAEGFDYRMPELHGGDRAGEGGPVPYPAACRPQAWSAAAAVSVLSDVLGLRPDRAAGRLLADPLPIARGIRADGLVFAGRPGRVTTDAAGRLVENSFDARGR